MDELDDPAMAPDAAGGLQAGAAAPLATAPAPGLLATASGALHPEHPMLARAQAALEKQLAAKRMRVEGELRERQAALSRAKKAREQVGVELYGFQQALANLQTSLERTKQRYDALSEQRLQAEQELVQLRDTVSQQHGQAKQEAQRAEAVQKQLDKLGATLRQVEAYNDSFKGEVAVTRRAAHAAEAAVQQLEKTKQRQDYLVDGMQETLRSLTAQLELANAQLAAQARETRAAKETLAQAEADMEGVRYEKKALLSQWRSGLAAIQRRDEALFAIQGSIAVQQQQELSISAEMAGFRNDVLREQLKGEQLAGVVAKVQGEAEFVARQAALAVEKQEKLAVQLGRLAAALEEAEEAVRRSGLEAKALSSEASSLDRATQRAFSELRDAEAGVLAALSDATSASQGARKAAANVRALHGQAAAEEARVAEVQNELARLGADCVATEAANERLAGALALLDEELRAKDAAIAKCEAALKRRCAEIERKTRETDALNRKLEKMVAAQPEAINTGPLEATVHNLGKEIDAKGREAQELQRRWISQQGELVALQAENGSLAEALARHKAEVTVLSQKRARVDAALAVQQAEARALRAAAGRLQGELGRVNGLIAQHTGLKALLQEEQLQLEGRALAELRELECTAASLAGAIQAGTLAKRQLLDELLEAERQLALAERKIQLEKEMQEVLDPSVGESVVATMKREVHRMELRYAELQRTQERLMQELERALSKHELIGIKALAGRSRSAGGGASSSSGGGGGGSSTGATASSSTAGRSRSPGGGAAAGSGHAHSRAVSDFKRSIRETDAEVAATQQRLQGLSLQAAQLEVQQAHARGATSQLAAQQGELAAAAARAEAQRYQALLSTSQLQRMAKGYEDSAAGRYKRQAAAPAAAGAAAATGAPAAAAAAAAGDGDGEPACELQGELSKAADKQARLLALLQQLQQSVPELGWELERVAAHAAAAAAWSWAGAGGRGDGAGGGCGAGAVVAVAQQQGVLI